MVFNFKSFIIGNLSDFIYFVYFLLHLTDYLKNVIQNISLFFKKLRLFDTTRKDVILLSRFSYTVNCSTQFSLTGPHIILAIG